MGAKSFLFLVFYVVMVVVQWQTPVAAARPVRSLLSKEVVSKRALENNGIVEGKALDDIIERINKGTVPNENSNSQNTKPHQQNKDYQNETVIFVLPAVDDDADDRGEQADADLRPAGNKGDAPVRRSLAKGFVEHGNWPELTEVTGRTSMGAMDPVQCQSNMAKYGGSDHPRFEYTSDEKMSHEWIAGVDRAWFSKNDKRGEVSHLCGKCIRLQDPNTGKQVGPKFMLVDRIYQKPGKSHSSIDIAAAPFKEIFGGHNPQTMFIPVDVGC